MSPQVLDRPDTSIASAKETEADLPWNVILYNDDVHSIEEVIFQVQKACSISMEAAFEITMEAHTKGRAVCFTGSFRECEKVAGILREIMLTVEIKPTT